MRYRVVLVAAGLLIAAVPSPRAQAPAASTRLEGDWVRIDPDGAGSFDGLGASLPPAKLLPGVSAGRGGRGVRHIYLDGPRGSASLRGSPDGKRLTITYTWNDPKIYAAPHVYRYYFERAPTVSSGGSPVSYALEEWCDAGDPVEKQSIVPPKQIIKKK